VSAVAAGAGERRKSDQHGPLELELPVPDPTHSLPEPAQELLEAAKRLLLRGGFEALRLDAIVHEAGKNKASVKYYFGNKEGLVGAIMDSLDHDQCLQLAERTKDVAGKERLERYIAGQTEMASDGDGFLMFFDILPRVARDDRLRERAGTLYDWYYQMNLQWLGLADRVTPESQDELVALASFLVAVVDGLAVQAAVRPRGFDLARTMRVLNHFLERALEEYVTAAAEGDRRPGTLRGGEQGEESSRR
jgi:AcrR family transcriptional regulator